MLYHLATKVVVPSTWKHYDIELHLNHIIFVLWSVFYYVLEMIIYLFLYKIIISTQKLCPMLSFYIK